MRAGTSRKPALAGGRPHPGAVLALHRPRPLCAGAGANLPRQHLDVPVPRGGAADAQFVPALQSRRHAGGRHPRQGRRDPRLREPLRPPRLAALPQGPRRGEGDRLRLSQLDLRPHRQAHRRRVPPRHRRQGRHAGRLQAGGARAAATAHRMLRRPGVGHARQPRRRRSRTISGKRSPPASSA